LSYPVRVCKGQQFSGVIRAARSTVNTRRSADLARDGLNLCDSPTINPSIALHALTAQNFKAGPYVWIFVTPKNITFRKEGRDVARHRPETQVPTAQNHMCETWMKRNIHHGPPLGCDMPPLIKRAKAAKQAYRLGKCAGG